MTTTYRFSRELDPLVHSKLPRKPLAAGRASPIGVCMTTIESLHFGALFLLLPAMLYQKVHFAADKCAFGTQDVDLEWLCTKLHDAPQWLLWLLVAEATFYLAMKAKLAYLQSIDPQIAYLKAAKIMTLSQRQVLWDRVMKAEADTVTEYFQTWFFGTNMDRVSVHELQNFITWCYFDGRNQEHLSEKELRQLDGFVNDAMTRMQQQPNGCPRRQSAGPKKLERIPSFSESSASDEEEEEEPLEAWLPCHEKDGIASTPTPELYPRLMKQALSRARSMPKEELVQVMKETTKSFAAFQKSNIDTSEPPLTSRRFGRPTADPILGVKIFPLVVHLIFFVAAEIPTRLLLAALGFSRRKIGSVTYNFHPGQGTKKDLTPLVFIHGIGVGPVVYLPLIWQMMTTGRPVFVPEVHSVSAFRSWVLPSAMLTPDQVATSLSLMLTAHGFSKATFSGHSFGTFWMSYMVKYAPNFVAGLVFVDPVNFCLYNSSLTRKVVYNQPDPGDVGYMIKTDVMVNWSVQRNFSWVRGNLFVEDIGDKPYTVFLSGKDNVAPSTVQEAYLRSHGCQVKDADQVSPQDYKRGNSVVVFPGCDHGLWLLNPLESLPKLVEAMEIQTRKVEKERI